MSNRARLEHRVLQVLDALVNNRQTEDSAVELKAEWPKLDEAYDTARQLAGHANAARGEPILWIIGANQRKREVCGAASCEVKSWYEPHRKHFDGEIIPGLLPELVVPYGDKSVVVLPFDTSRAPYLIKMPHINGVKCQFEVPYRIGAHTYTARRQDMLQILVPQSMEPIVDVLSMSVGSEKKLAQATINLYIADAIGGRVVIPSHKCAVGLRRSTDVDYFYAPGIKLQQMPTSLHPASHDVAIDIGARVLVSCQFPIPTSTFGNEDISICVKIGIAGADVVTVIERVLTRVDTDQKTYWSLKRA